MRNTLTRSVVSRPLLLLNLLFVGCAIAVAQQQSPRDLVQFIPQPRQISLKSARFQFNNKSRIVLADLRSEDDQFAATDFSDDLRETAKLQLKVGGSRARHSILIGTIDLPGVQSALKKFGITAPQDLDAEGY